MAKYYDKIMWGYCSSEECHYALRSMEISLQIKFQITQFTTQISIFLLPYLNWDANVTPNSYPKRRWKLPTYKLTTEILNAMNNKLQIGGIFCDLEKAFDCVNHNILLSKLKFYGINDKYFQLFQSYLNNRYCRTALYNNSVNRNTVSNWATVRHGVHQGSILGPLLFLLYINDLPKIINTTSSPIIFADDT